MTLRGPADPETFREQDQWGRRWYVDTLPACPIAEPSDARHLSVTAAKKAWSKPFMKKIPTGKVVPLDAYRVACFAANNREAWQNLDDDQAIELLASSAQHDLKKAGARGSETHTLIEGFLAGQEPLAGMIPAAAAYVDICHKLVAELNLEPTHREVVAIRRGGDEGPGWGGTIDLVARWNDGTYIVDWKTRAADSRHGAYPEDAGQLGAYGASDYLIVADGDTARRRPMPDLAGGLVVSIKPDSYEVYPVDLDEAGEAFASMRTVYDMQKSGQSQARRAVGKPVHVLTPPPQVTEAVSTAGDPPPPGAASVERRGWVRARCGQVIDAGHADTLRDYWPIGIPKLSSDHPHDDDELDAIVAACRQVCGIHNVPFSEDGVESADPDNPFPDRATDDELDHLKRRVAGLPSDLHDNLTAWVREHSYPRFSQASRAQIETVWSWMSELEATHAARKIRVDDALAGSARMRPAPLKSAVCRLAGGTDIDSATAQQAELMAVIAAAVDTPGLLETATTGDACEIRAAESGLLLQLAGGKKQLLAAGRGGAKTYGLPSPNSSDVVGEDPLLTVLAWHELTQPNIQLSKDPSV